MEQHSQAQERQTARQEDLQREETSQRSPERETLAAAGLTARALLAGAPLWDLPPANLEELETAPFSVPEAQAQLTRPPEGLAAPVEPTAAFDPANLLG